MPPQSTAHPGPAHTTLRSTLELPTNLREVLQCPEKEVLGTVKRHDGLLTALSSCQHILSYFPPLLKLLHCAGLSVDSVQLSVAPLAHSGDQPYIISQHSVYREPVVSTSKC